jgi:hypothetical protein
MLLWSLMLLWCHGADPATPIVFTTWGAPTRKKQRGHRRRLTRVPNHMVGLVPGGRAPVLEADHHSVTALTEHIHRGMSVRQSAGADGPFRAGASTAARGTTAAASPTELLHGFVRG